MKVKYRRSTDITVIKIMAKVTQSGVLSALDRGCGGMPRSPFTEGAWPGAGGAGGRPSAVSPFGHGPSYTEAPCR